ncbi:metalloendopeptidase, partial [Lactiplantibacillus plantarum]
MQWAEWMAKLQNKTKHIVENSSRATQRAVERASTFVRTHKKQTATITAGLVLTTAIGASAYFYYKSNIISIYHVAVNGQEIGVVNNPEVVHS